MRRKIELIQQVLDQHFPDPPIPLHHDDPFTLLIAVLLSAQCTDKRVNEMTPALFARAKTPEAMQKVPLDELEELIRSAGLFRTKAKAIQSLSEQIVQNHNGEVPSTFAQLEALPGVGHKTASVVMSQAFGIPAFPVDTHIHRLAKRWGLSDGTSVEKTEADLKALFPEKDWNRLHLQIIYFARAHCPARGHDETVCPICSIL